MAESNATQVILTDDGIKIIKAQSTADNAAGGVANLNDPNLMNVIEKQNNIVQFAGLTSQYNVLVQNAKDEGIGTTAVTTAYNNLNIFMADILADSDHASDIDRARYKKYQDAYNEELAKLQNALQNNTNNKFTSAASAISQAASTANVAKSAADSAYTYANSEIAVQSTATAKAQSTADSAFKEAQSATAYTDKQIASQASAVSEVSKTATEASLKANSALDTANGANAEIVKLKGGSTATIAKLEDGLGTKVSNDTFDSYQTQTASQFAQTVKEADFKTYQTQTSKLIESKVDNGTYQTDKTQTAGAIASKVSSGEFKTYQTQTDKALSSKVSSSDYESDREQTASQIADKVSSGEFSTYKTQTDKLIAEKVSNGDFNTYKSQTADLISSKVANKDFSAYQATTAKAIENKVESKDFNTYKTQTADAISSKVSSTDFNNLKISNRNLALNTATGFVVQGNNTANQCLPFKTSRAITKGTTITVSFDIVSTTAIGTFIIQLIGGDWQQVTNGNNPLTTTEKHYTHTLVAMSDHADGLQLRLDNATGKVTMTNFIISESSKEVSWTPAPEDQATQSQVTQLSNEINLRVTKNGLLDQINIQAGNTLISSSGQLTLSAKSVFLDSANPVIMKSANIDKLLVGKKLTAADISANTFTTNNGTFTVNQNGAITAKDMTLSGGKLYSPTINAGTITSAIINGTTFHGGDVINNQHNTSHFYPMTIESNGTYKTTFYDQMVGLQSIIESGGLQHKFRSMVADSNGHFVASNAALDGQGFHSQSGYTSAKDSTFSSPQTITGYVDVTPASGIYLYGPTQKINFAGNKDNIGSDGITMDSYGNMYGQPNSLYWRIGDANAKAVADFGFDTANKRDILLYRNVSVGNLFLGVGHTIGMLDKKPLYFKQGTSSGNMLDIKAGTVYYTGLTKSSLLSVKQDVKKADTAYWAQLVNSIDLATYQYKTDDNTSHIRLSSIVDDVNDTKQWQLPDVFVSRDEDGKLCGVDDSVLLNATLATVQEQQKEIDKLNGHSMELEARLNKLEAKLNG